MKKMSLSDLGNLAEAFAAVGVIISLIYLAAQINQNTKAVRASSYQEVANGISNFQTLMAESKELSNIYLQGIEDLNQLSSAERIRFEMAIGQLFVKYDVAVYFYHENLIDELAIMPYNNYILLMLKNPGIAAWWEGAQHYYSDRMRIYIESQRTG